MSGRSTDKPAQAASDADSDYDSEEDADFQDDDAISNSSSDESEAPVKSKSKNNDIESGDEATIRKSKKKRKEAENESQDLILTRAQKRAKAEEGEAVTKVGVTEDKPEDLDALWKQFNDKPAIEVTTTPATATESTSDTIKIKRSYEFAGQLVTEEKEVPRDSAEAKAYLSSLHNSSSNQAPNQGQSAKPLPRRPVKRKSNLEAMAKGDKPAKLNVLEKSRLDWAGFVDKEGIHDDLKQFNKDGYVERQEFLKRTR